MIRPYFVTYSSNRSDEIRTILILGHSECHAVNLLYQYFAARGFDLNEICLQHHSCEYIDYISPRVISDLKEFKTK